MKKVAYFYLTQTTTHVWLTNTFMRVIILLIKGVAAFDRAVSPKNRTDRLLKGGQIIFCASNTGK